MSNMRWNEKCEMCGEFIEGDHIPDGMIGVCEDCYNLATFHPEILKRILGSNLQVIE